MGWRESFRQASFKGVIFYIDSADSEFGRRTVTHEYPQRDKPYTEDMGKKARVDRVTAYLVGADYQITRDQLIRACEEPGAGVFVHPYQGSKRVVCTGLAVRESRQNGGYCEISLSFVEDGELTFPTAITNLIKAAAGTSAAVQVSAIDQFVQAFEDVSQYPQFLRDELTTVVNTVLAPLERVLNATSTFATGVNLLKSKTQQLLLTPELFADQLVSNIRNVVGSTTASSASSIYREMSTIGATIPAVRETTRTRTAQARNQQAIIDLVETVAVALNIEVSTGLNYDSYDAAIVQREILLDDIDRKQETADDEVFTALRALRVQLVKAIPAPGLPELKTYQLALGQPALVLAYNLYGDANKEADIIKRNKVRHPGFLPGGQSIEVLSNA